jgi:hypothetical protein
MEREEPDTILVSLTPQFTKKLKNALAYTLLKMGNTEGKFRILSDPELEYLRVPSIIPQTTINLGLNLLIIPDNLKDDIHLFTHDTRMKSPYKMKGAVYVELEEVGNPGFRNKYSIPFV